MNIEDAHYEHPELWTDFERREHDDDSADTYMSIIPSFMRNTDNNEIDIMADGFSKEAFGARKPAFGWTEKELATLTAQAGKSEYHEYLIHKTLRNKMCRRLICCSGAKTTSDLCAILRDEMKSGVPAPVPEWYTFSKARFGPSTGKTRRFGYSTCTNMNKTFMCYETEDLTRQFLQCSQCKLAQYCSQKCQRQDWKARHKVVCKEAKKQHDKTSKVASFLDMFARQCEGE